VAGDEIDEAIIQYIKREYNLIVGERTAEKIKIALAAAHPDAVKDEVMEVKGRDITEGVPKGVRVTSQEIMEAIVDPVNQIVNAVKESLERIPPELSADLTERGIVLAGGGALLAGLDLLLTEKTGLPVIVADDPLTCVVMGAGKVLEELTLLKKVSLS